MPEVPVKIYVDKLLKEIRKMSSPVALLPGPVKDRALRAMAERIEADAEVILAAKSGREEALVYELADLVFHSLVLLGARGIPPERVAAELERRFGTSGIDEKAARKA